MEAVIVVLIIGAGIWFWRKGKSTKAPTTASPTVRVLVDAPVHVEESRKATSAPNSTASAPTGTPLEAWSSQLLYQDAVGESNYEASFKQLLKDYGHKLPLPEYGVELNDARAVLATDPDNPYDRDAVAIWVDGRRLVGYLPRDVAALYAHKLIGLEREGRNLRVEARVWVGPGWEDERSVRGSISLRIPTPDGITPFNELPDEDHIVLPAGRALQVTGEESHMEALNGFVIGDGDRHVAATLHVVTEQKTDRSQPVDLVEVRLDGERVGTLTKAMSEQIRDLVAFVAAKGKVPVSRAVVKGTHLKADVTLYVARTVEVPHAWLEAL